MAIGIIHAEVFSNTKNHTKNFINITLNNFPNKERTQLPAMGRNSLKWSLMSQASHRFTELTLPWVFQSGQRSALCIDLQWYLPIIFLRDPLRGLYSGTPAISAL